MKPIYEKYDRIDKKILDRLITTGLRRMVGLVNSNEDFCAIRPKSNPLNFKIFPEYSYVLDAAWQRSKDRLMKQLIPSLEGDGYLYFGTILEYTGQNVQLVKYKEYVIDIMNYPFIYRTKIDVDMKDRKYYRMHYEPILKYERYNK